MCVNGTSAYFAHSSGVVGVDLTQDPLQQKWPAAASVDGCTVDQTFGTVKMSYGWCVWVAHCVV